MASKFSTHGNFSFAELRSKEVVNSVDGKRLGRIIDIVFGSRDGRIMGIVLPHCRKNVIFRNSEPIFIPWLFVERIGEDVIMVRLSPDQNRIVAKRPHNMHHGGIAKIAELEGAESEKIEEPVRPINPVVAKKKSNFDGPKELKKPNCDGQCEKCMLFDCEYRWKHGDNSHRNQAKIHNYDDDKEDKDYLENNDY